jgi:hypothetical protein
MDVLSMTVAYRENILKYVKPMLDERSNIWVRKVLSDINKKIITVDNDYIAAHAILMYRNFTKFFEEFCTDVTPSAILFTLYACAIQLGVRHLGDEVETYEQFQDNIDMEDFEKVDVETVKEFDIRSAIEIIYSRTSDEPREIPACGLYTLELLDFI